MQKLKLRLVLLSVGTVLTLFLSHAVAQAACDHRKFGGNAYGKYDCTLITSCGGWCYYSCSCSDLFPGYTCDDVLKEAGFEIVAGGPPCSG